MSFSCKDRQHHLLIIVLLCCSWNIEYGNSETNCVLPKISVNQFLEKLVSFDKHVLTKSPNLRTTTHACKNKQQYDTVNMALWHSTHTNRTVLTNHVPY